MDEGERATRWAPRQLSGRGLSYWTDGKGDERIIYVTTGYRLVSLNAKTGQPIAGFGNNGVVDLKVGVVIGKDKQIDLEKGEIGLHSTPTVVNDMIIVGSSMFEGLGYRLQHQRQGPGPRVRRPHRQADLALQHDSEAAASSATTRGRTGRGSGPATSACGRRSPSTPKPASSTCRSRRRPSTNTAATAPATTCSPRALVAVDLKTGERKWHFQFVHHPLWDHDMSSAPLLIDATIDGKPRKLRRACRSSRAGSTCFDRITGQPIWPIEERPVPQTTMPARRRRQTQPIPDQAAAVLAHVRRRERPHRLHAGSCAQQALEEPEEVPLGADRRTCRRSGPRRQLLGSDQHRQHRRRRELAGLRLRSRDRHLLHAGGQHRRHGRQVRRGGVRQGEPRPVQEQTRAAALGSRAELRPAAPQQPGRAPAPAAPAASRFARRRGPPGAGRGPRRPADREAAVRRDRGDRPQQAASCCSRCRTATRRTRSATTRCCGA